MQLEIQLQSKKFCKIESTSQMQSVQKEISSAKYHIDYLSTHLVLSTKQITNNKIYIQNLIDILITVVALIFNPFCRTLFDKIGTQLGNFHGLVIQFPLVISVYCLFLTTFFI
jgi:hypothetical protein